MIEIFETCQTKSIAKQTNRDESLIIRSIGVNQGYECTTSVRSDLNWMMMGAWKCNTPAF